MSPQKEKIYNKIIMTVILGHYKNMPPAAISAGGIFGYKMSAEYKKLINNYCGVMIRKS